MKRLVLIALLLGGCKKQVVFDLDLPDGPVDVTAQDPLPLLDDASRSTTPSLRRRAIAVGMSTQPATRDTWAGRGLFDADGYVQSATAGAAEPYASEPGVRALLEGLCARDSADPYARSRAAFVLARTGGSDTARDAMSAAARDARDPWTRSALAAGAFALGDAEALPAVTAAIARGDIPLELAFVLDLGRTGSEELAAALASAQERVEPELQVAVAAARSLLGDREGDSVLNRATRSDDPLVQFEVIDTALRLDAPRDLVASARHSADPLARAYADAAWDALRGRLGSKLRAALAHDDAELRVAALRLLPDKPGAADLARHALGDEDARVRAAAAARLGELGPRPADTSLLQALLLDDDALVRIEAAGALLR